MVLQLYKIAAMHTKCTGTFAEAPKVDLSKLAGREIRVRAGEPIRVDVPVSGSPAPVVSWQKDNKSLSPTDRVSPWHLSHFFAFLSLISRDHRLIFSPFLPVF